MPTFALIITAIALPFAFVALRTAKDHPKGLPVLFFSEMWERFCFYGMRALLILYMTERIGFDDARGYSVYAAYGALVYAFPVLGGMLADRILGYRRAILLGGTLMFLGEMSLLIEGENTLYLGLALLCLGNGFFKPNISSTVGRLYGEGDSRRDSGFTIFYMGINLGALLAPLWCGFLGQDIGPFALGFGLAGLGMAFGMIWFHLGRDKLEGKAEAPNPELLKKWQWPIVLGALVTAVPLTLALKFSEVTEGALPVVMIGVFGYLIFVAFSEDKVARERLFALMILMIFHALFWAFFEQAGSSLTLFADRCVDRDVLGLNISASQLQAVNPLFILAFAPVFSIIWTKSAAAGKQPSIPNKFALGMVQLGLGFLVVTWGTAMTGDDARVSLFWLIMMYLLHTTGELCLSPVGLSAVTKLAPERITAFIMGAWFLTVSLGHVIAGLLAKLVAQPAESAAAMTPKQMALSYTELYGQLGYVAVGAGILLFLGAPLIRKLMHGVE